MNSRLSRFGAASPTSPWYDRNFFRRTLEAAGKWRAVVCRCMVSRYPLGWTSRGCCWLIAFIASKRHADTSASPRLFLSRASTCIPSALSIRARRDSIVSGVPANCVASKLLLKWLQQAFNKRSSFNVVVVPLRYPEPSYFPRLRHRIEESNEVVARIASRFCCMLTIDFLCIYYKFCRVRKLARRLTPRATADLIRMC